MWRFPHSTGKSVSPPDALQVQGWPLEMILSRLSCLLAPLWVRPVEGKRRVEDGKRWNIDSPSFPGHALLGRGCVPPPTAPTIQSSVPVGHLDAFPGKMSIQVVCPFLIRFGGVVIELYEFFMYFEYEPLFQYTVCKNFLPFCRLPLCFVNNLSLLCRSF